MSCRLKRAITSGTSHWLRDGPEQDMHVGWQTLPRASATCTSWKVYEQKPVTNNSDEAHPTQVAGICRTQNADMDKLNPIDSYINFKILQVSSNFRDIARAPQTIYSSELCALGWVVQLMDRQKAFFALDGCSGCCCYCNCHCMFMLCNKTFHIRVSQARYFSFQNGPLHCLKFASWRLPVCSGQLHSSIVIVGLCWVAGRKLWSKTTTNPLALCVLCKNTS